MDDDSFSDRMVELRREIELIRQEERKYRGRKVHSVADKAAHTKREVRLLQIRSELETLRRQGKRQ
jgi:hypothetical protein